MSRTYRERTSKHIEYLKAVGLSPYREHRDVPNLYLKESTKRRNRQKSRNLIHRILTEKIDVYNVVFPVYTDVDDLWNYD